eukprot:8464280-Prorocentrum_lima.AAC.1
MTSSLVGSEMCIRDRKKAVHIVMCHHSPCSYPIFRPTPTPGRTHTVLWAVSYTHLTLPTICSV